MIRFSGLMPARVVFAALVLWVLPVTPQVRQPAQAGPEKMRTRAWDALRSRLREEKYLNHSLAVEAIMRELAAANGGDKDEWGLAGLLHDIDIGTTANDPTRHGVAGAQILQDLGFSAAVVHAVKAHDDGPGIARTSRLDHALHCADQVYWLMLSTGLTSPSEKFDSADPKAIWRTLQEMPSKRALVVRVSGECAEIGFSMPRTVEAAHTALRKLSPAMTGR